MSLVIALNRGRILAECLPLLAEAGIEPDEDVRTSRKLIFPTRRGGHKLVIMRGADVPTYVTHGTADIGVVGKDTLLEAPPMAGYYERLDLNIARCRIVTAFAEEAPPERLAYQPAHNDAFRVATKFVNVSRGFFAGKGRQVTIIPLAGAMEIAPTLNLADCIVDIVDTGNTLKANGLKEHETIAHISSRLIANRASMKTKFDEIEALLSQLRAAVERRGQADGGGV